MYMYIHCIFLGRQPVVLEELLKVSYMHAHAYYIMPIQIAQTGMCGAHTCLSTLSNYLMYMYMYICVDSTSMLSLPLLTQR